MSRSVCPAEYICPITQEIMTDPVMISETGQVTKPYACNVSVSFIRRFVEHTSDSVCRPTRELRSKIGGDEGTTPAPLLTLACLAFN